MSGQQEAPSHHARRLEAERSVMAWTRDKRREGPRAVPHDPAPRTQHGALCFCFCHLFSARKRHRELRGQVGQEAVQRLQGRQGSQVVQREGKAAHAQFWEGRLIPVRTVHWGDKGRSPGARARCCPMRELIPHRTLLCSVKGGRGPVGRQLGTRVGARAGEHPTPLPPETAGHSPQLAPGPRRAVPLRLGFCLWDSGGKAGPQLHADGQILLWQREKNKDSAVRFPKT